MTATPAAPPTTESRASAPPAEPQGVATVPPSLGNRAAPWLGLAANLGALVGLFLVVAQLRQNRDLMRAQVRHELASGVTDLLLQSATNPQLASVLRRGNAGDSLSPDEALQFRSRTNAMFRYAEDVHYQYRQGLYDEEEFSRQKLTWEVSFQRSVGMSQYYCEARRLYSARFVATMDSLLPAGSCPPAP